MLLVGEQRRLKSKYVGNGDEVIITHDNGSVSPDRFLKKLVRLNKEKIKNKKKNICSCV